MKQFYFRGLAVTLIIVSAVCACVGWWMKWFVTPQPSSTNHWIIASYVGVVVLIVITSLVDFRPKRKLEKPTKLTNLTKLDHVTTTADGQGNTTVLMSKITYHDPDGILHNASIDTKMDWLAHLTVEPKADTATPFKNVANTAGFCVKDIEAFKAEVAEVGGITVHDIEASPKTPCGVYLTSDNGFWTTRQTNALKSILVSQLANRTVAVFREITYKGNSSIDASVQVIDESGNEQFMSMDGMIEHCKRCLV
jgi:hypothetical protein